MPPPKVSDTVIIAGAMTYTHLPFSFYEFLAPVRLNRIKPQDVAFLESQKCLHLPTSDVLDQFLRQYFLYVHPCLPIIDEARFWYAYRHPDKSSYKIPLLVFQAMLFAAASVSLPWHIATISVLSVGVVCYD